MLEDVQGGNDINRIIAQRESLGGAAHQREIAARARHAQRLLGAVEADRLP